MKDHFSDCILEKNYLDFFKKWILLSVGFAHVSTPLCVQFRPVDVHWKKAYDNNTIEHTLAQTNHKSFSCVF